jgi:hypothetical protein
MPATVEGVVGLERIRRETAVIEVRGTAPLIVHAWSQKARQQMLDKQQGKKVRKEAKDPQADFEASRYKFADGSGDGFPVTAFKKSTIAGGGRIFGKAVKMTELRQNLLFLPDGLGTDGMQLVALDTAPPEMREDMVRISMGTSDIRHRAMYPKWSATLRIEFIPALIDLGSIVALVDAGGTNGIGEWRPEKNGSFGTYEVVGA